MRLIDADKFKQDITAITVRDNLVTSKCNALCRLIDRQPTAFDVDKVCRKINENKEVDNWIDADHVIRIVRSQLSERRKG